VDGLLVDEEFVDAVNEGEGGDVVCDTFPCDFGHLLLNLANDAAKLDGTVVVGGTIIGATLGTDILSP